MFIDDPWREYFLEGNGKLEAEAEGANSIRKLIGFLWDEKKTPSGSAGERLGV
jgi:hypothetical protein